MANSSALGKILVVDNDEHITELLRCNLRAEGYDVSSHADACTAMKLDLSDTHVVIVDAFGPNGGTALLNELATSPETAHIGIIVCSSGRHPGEAISALDAGADDYIVKPFSLRELVARAKAVIRRHARSSAATQGTTIEFHTLRLDLMTRRVIDGDNVLTLTKTEYAILEMLLKQVNNYVSRAEIYKNVWKDDLEKSNDRIVDTNISRLPISSP